MKIAYFSPLNPMKSGISDYSEELIEYLSKYATLDLWVEGFKPTNKKIINNYVIIDYIKNPPIISQLEQYNAFIYNLGNNPHYHMGIYKMALEHPGYIILHDFVLYFLVTGYYLNEHKSNEKFIEAMAYCHGDRGFAEGLRIIKEWKNPLTYNHPEKWPLNKIVLEKAKGIIVHSISTMNLVQQLNINVPIIKINQINYDKGRSISEDQKYRIRQEYGIAKNEIMLASFGYVAPTKRIHQVLKALKQLIDRGISNFKYVLVGEGNYINSLIKDLNLEKYVALTGFVDLRLFDQLVESADIIVNLRYPSMGETSASLLRAMTAGKPCLVSDVDWFDELPDDVVIKIPVDEKEINNIADAIANLIEQPILRGKIGNSARNYTLKEHNPDRISQQIIEFIKNTPAASGNDLLTNHIHRLVKEFVNWEIPEDSNFLIKYAKALHSIHSK